MHWQLCLKFCTAAVVSMGLTCLAGCGGSMQSVQGTVVYRDGTPARELAGGHVDMEKIDGRVSAKGEIQEDGTFRLGTTKPGDGAQPGNYRVAITEPRPADFDKPPRAILDPKYHNFAKSGITVTIEPKSNNLTITVDKNPAK